MKVIVCVDEKGGVAFNHRRQSRDKELTKKLLELLRGKRLYLSSYSKVLFPEKETITIREDYLLKTPEGEYCFAEREELSDLEERIEELVLVKWNRAYPRDKVLKLDLNNYHLTKSFDFQGNSHEKITVEIYEKNR